MASEGEGGKLMASDDDEWEYVFEDELEEGDEWEYLTEEEQAEKNPFAFKKVQGMTDDLNSLYGDGVEVARELKGVFDDLKDAFSPKGFFGR